MIRMGMRDENEPGSGIRSRRRDRRPPPPEECEFFENRIYRDAKAVDVNIQTSMSPEGDGIRLRNWEEFTVGRTNGNGGALGNGECDKREGGNAEHQSVFQIK
jgi:hypothetical protein